MTLEECLITYELAYGSPNRPGFGGRVPVMWEPGELTLLRELAQACEPPEPDAFRMYTRLKNYVYSREPSKI